MELLSLKWGESKDLVHNLRCNMKHCRYSLDYLNLLHFQEFDDNTSDI